MAHGSYVKVADTCMYTRYTRANKEVDERCAQAAGIEAQGSSKVAQATHRD